MTIAELNFNGWSEKEKKKEKEEEHAGGFLLARATQTVDSLVGSGVAGDSPVMTDEQTNTCVVVVHKAASHILSHTWERISFSCSAVDFGISVSFPRKSAKIFLRNADSTARSLTGIPYHHHKHSHPH